MSRRIWDEGVMQWRRQKATGSWIEDNPPLPGWAKESGGFVAADRFIRMWAGAASLSTLKQVLFWMSLEDIESQAMLLSDWLEDCGYAPLSPKLLWETAPLSQAALAALVAEGLVVSVGAGAAEVGEVAAEEEVSAEVAEDVLAEDGGVEDEVVEPLAAAPEPAPARPDEDPDRDFVPYSMQHPSESVGIGVLKGKKP